MTANTRNRCDDRVQIHICSDHPVVLHALDRLLSRSAEFRASIHPSCSAPSGFSDSGTHVALLDIHSINDWTETLLQWSALGAEVVVLVSESSVGSEAKLRLLELGVHGIVTLSANLEKDLPRALSSVANGKLWVESHLVQEYIRNAHAVRLRLQSSGKGFTPRENEIVTLLRRGFSNRQIALLLKISPRTVKFHVSNILQKSHLESRIQLQDAFRATSIHCMSPVGSSFTS
jgi:DNA-binding NarL/FixJ family response regulator